MSPNSCSSEVAVLPPASQTQFSPWVLGTIATSGIRREKLTLWSKNVSPCIFLMCCNHRAPSGSLYPFYSPLTQPVLIRVSCWADVVPVVLFRNGPCGIKRKHRALQIQLGLSTLPQSSNSSEMNYSFRSHGKFPTPKILYSILSAIRKWGKQIGHVHSTGIRLTPDLWHSNPHLTKWLHGRRQQTFVQFPEYLHKKSFDLSRSLPASGSFDIQLHDPVV